MNKEENKSWKMTYHILKEHYHAFTCEDKPVNIKSMTQLPSLIKYEKY